MQFAIFHFEYFPEKQFYKDLVFLYNRFSIEMLTLKPLFDLSWLPHKVNLLSVLIKSNIIIWFWQKNIEKSMDLSSYEWPISGLLSWIIYIMLLSDLDNLLSV